MQILKRFSIQVIIRVLLIVLVVILLEFIYGDERLFFNQIILLILLSVQVYNLIWYVNQSNRDVAQFLEAIKQSDFTISHHKTYLGKGFSHLYQSFAEIHNTFEKVKTEREAQYHFLQLLVEHINIGIITVAEDDSLTLINSTALKLLAIEKPLHWHSLKKDCPEFLIRVDEIGKSGKRLIEISIDKESLILSVDVTSTKLIGKVFRLITFKDIQNEIDQNEMEAWHKLIRILTHEIMNSLTTISSLTETMQMMLAPDNGDNKGAQSISDSVMKDLRFSLDTIGKRSDGLLHFVEDYRKVTRVPPPDLETVSVRKMLEETLQLLRGELEAEQIKLKVEIEDFELRIDQGQIDQVLINLISNSRYALSGQKDATLKIQSFQSESGYHISVSDNGVGIDKKAMGEIFVPFFTTREDGSGIGLSLSKQIMSLHGGKIMVRSSPGKETVVLLTFNNNN